MYIEMWHLLISKMHIHTLSYSSHRKMNISYNKQVRVNQEIARQGFFLLSKILFYHARSMLS